MITLALSLVMSCTPPAVHDTSDLDFRVPNFDNAPRFDMRDGMRGRNPIRQQRETRPRLERRDDGLVRLLRKELGDKYTIIRWRNSIIVIPKEDTSKRRKNETSRRKKNR